MSDLANRVYEFLQTIPKGKVITYQQIALHLGNPHLARVVGNILHHNPDPDLNPCYKVVNCQGKLAPHFAFGGANIQKQLLESEGIIVINNQVDLQKYQYHPENPEKCYNKPR